MIYWRKKIFDTGIPLVSEYLYNINSDNNDEADSEREFSNAR